MTLIRSDREEILEKITTLVRTKYYDPAFGGRDWNQIVSLHRDQILAAESQSSFEAAMQEMFKPLHNNLGLLRSDTPINPRNSINASFRSVPTQDGPRWAFQDVLPRGLADRAQIRPADLLLSIQNQPIAPPTQPSFPMQKSIDIIIRRPATGREMPLTLSTQTPKFKDNPYTEPQSIAASVIDSSIGYLKISLFPGRLGIDFARHLDREFSSTLKHIDRLVVDLRGNPGGGIGGLRLMSYLAPGRLPVGYSLSRAKSQGGYNKADLIRFSRIPDSRLQVPFLILKFRKHGSIAVFTENLGARKFHGRVALLVNEHSTGAAEMVTQFVRDNHLGPIVGAKTPGRLAARASFDVGHGYRLALPALAWMSWTGVNREGQGIEPDYPVDWSFDSAVRGIDNQLDYALNTVRLLS